MLVRLQTHILPGRRFPSPLRAALCIILLVGYSSIKCTFNISMTLSQSGTLIRVIYWHPCNERLFGSDNAMPMMLLPLSRCSLTLLPCLAFALLGALHPWPLISLVFVCDFWGTCWSCTFSSGYSLSFFNY